MRAGMRRFDDHGDPWAPRMELQCGAVQDDPPYRAGEHPGHRATSAGAPRLHGGA